MLNIPFLNISKINNIKPQKGNLILAEPFMQDDHFGRSVILMCEHNDEGSYGFILNNKLDINLDELVPEIEVKDLSVYYGGPVHSSNLFYLHQLEI